MWQGEGLPQQRPKIWVGAVARLLSYSCVVDFRSVPDEVVSDNSVVVVCSFGLDAMTYDDTRTIQYAKLAGAAH